MPRILAALALLVSACASPLSPAPDLAGTWAESFSIPGESLILTLDSSGSGQGTYAFEAGRSGIVQVTGTVVHSTITLVIRYDYGLIQTFIGILADANHLMGGIGDNSTLIFTRR